MTFHAERRRSRGRAAAPGLSELDQLQAAFTGGARMATLCETNGATARCQSIVVMARVVDAAGCAVRPSDINSICYSILEVGGDGANAAQPVGPYDHVPLERDEVFLDGLEFGGLWKVDEEGFNFRQEVCFARTAKFPKPQARYHIEYEVVSRAGETTLLRFLLKVS